MAYIRLLCATLLGISTVLPPHVCAVDDTSDEIPRLKLKLISDVIPPEDISVSRPYGRPGAASDTHSCGSVRAVPSELRDPANMWPNGLDTFYQKYTEAYGIPVLGSSILPDSALQRACYVVRFILADSYDARNYYYKYYGRFALMAESEVTTDIPEHASLGPSWNWARGLGATESRPVSTAAEENALCYPTDSYYIEDILLHEFAHGLHILGVAYAVPDFDSRLQSTYNNALANGLWYNTYADDNSVEYFAEGVQSYFEDNGYASPPNGIHNEIDTREKLRNYDPGLYNLITEVFACGNEYIKRCDNDREAELNQVLTLNCYDGSGVPGCVDNDPNCAYWASIGECENNPLFMLEECKLSCDVCTSETCVDNDPNCAYWASIGECDANPGFMLEECKLSCGVC